MNQFHSSYITSNHHRFTLREIIVLSAFRLYAKSIANYCSIAKQQKTCAAQQLRPALRIGGGAAGRAHLALAKPTLLLSRSKTV